MDPSTATRVARLHGPEGASTCMQQTTYVWRGCNRSLMCCHLLLETKTLSLPLSHCMEKRHGLDGTAADPRICRRLYDLALSQETVIPSANISERSSNGSPTDVATSVWLLFVSCARFQALECITWAESHIIVVVFSTSVIYAGISLWARIGNQV